MCIYQTFHHIIFASFIKLRDMKKLIFLPIAIMVLTATFSSQSNAAEMISSEPDIQSATDSTVTKQTIGFAIDLLPIIMSASTGHFGYSAQVWYGYDKYRIRGVVAGFQMPDQLMGNEDFKDLNTTAIALIFDYFLKNNFRGWWFGGGFEMWNNTITSKTDNNDYTFTDYVATAGSGYIFKVYRNFYIEPWGAVHYVLSNEKVSVGATEYTSKKFQGEVSVKLGWHF